MAAEGIQKPRYYDGASIRNVADGYIEELVKRNMVISVRDKLTSRFETCHLHDMMREVCLLKAEEENFLQIVDRKITANAKFPCKSRRLTVHRHDGTYHLEGENPKLRSLLFLKKQLRGMVMWMASDLFFSRIQLMRVLDLSHAEFEGGKLPSSIGKLIHLRYLSLSQAYVTHLPSSIQNLKLLVYLNLCVQEKYSIYMPPNFMKDTRELVYLFLPEEINDKVVVELGNLVNLETLQNFSIKHCSVRDLLRMKNLETLSVFVDSKGCTTEALSSSLSKFRHLESLTVSGYSNDKEGFVLDCCNLKQLNSSIYMPRLNLPSHLTNHNSNWLSFGGGSDANSREAASLI